MAELRDYYEVLSVERTADGDIIKKSYRRLAMQFHPDKNPGDKTAEEKFKEAAQAYEILSDPQKRAQYDRFGHAAFQGGRGGGGPHDFSNAEDVFSAFSDIFGDFFGGQGRGQRRGGARARETSRRGADLRYVIEISVKSVIQGEEKDIEFETEKNCDECSGTGAERGSDPITCPTCGGAGQVVRAQGFFSMASTCPTCKGEGVTIPNPCKKCRGRGRIADKRKIRVTIPPGVDTGTRLRVSGEGEGGYRGGAPGDLFVEISVAADNRFARQGDDLYSTAKIDYIQILLGGEVEIETVTGKKRIEIPKGIALTELLRVPDEGIPSLRGSRRGDLLLAVEVQFPKKVNKEEEKLLRELASLRKVPILDEKGSAFFSRKK